MNPSLRGHGIAHRLLRGRDCSSW
ncbi:hypothetical protein [Rhizobium redzepovicii]